MTAITFIKESCSEAATYVAETAQSAAFKLQEVIEDIWERTKSFRESAWSDDMPLGLATATLSTAGVAYLFSAAHPLAGAAFGATNYLLTKVFYNLTEDFKDVDDREKDASGKIAVILGTGYAVTAALMIKVLRCNLTFYTAIPLSLASLAGHLITKSE
jgi:hypothetical protein